MSPTIEMNYCRRCGTKLSQQQMSHVYKCEQGHVIFCNASPAVGVVLFNNKHEVLILERAFDPGKGKLDVPGGFCDGAEPLEQAIVRELEEEVGIAAHQYTAPEWILSGIDWYDYAAELLPVQSVMFRASLTDSVQPVAADDAATAQFMRLEDIDMEAVHFPSVRAALERLRDQDA